MALEPTRPIDAMGVTLGAPAVERNWAADVAVKPSNEQVVVAGRRTGKPHWLPRESELTCRS